jgi:general L-amino acid transport system permease protein
MSNASQNFVSKTILPPQPAPAGEKGTAHWIRKNLMATPKDVVLTILAIALLAWAIPHIVNWLFIQATWTGTGRAVCATTVQGGTQPDGWSGACWAFVSSKFTIFMVGLYTPEERWRPALVAVLAILTIAPMMIPSFPRKGLNAILAFIVLPIVSFFLLYGGFGLEVVETQKWGGLMVNLVLCFVAIVVSFPLGILLALGRRSKMPIIRMLCVLFIEVIRGIPLITVLFMASVMLPLFLPHGWTVDKLLRAVIGVSIFTAAYMAEVFRGGLQAVPKGQFEGADSLGLG